MKNKSGDILDYYLIHGLDKKREVFMKAQFRHFGIPLNNVTWINYPNYNDPIPKNICTNPQLTAGQIAITYKHYLVLDKIVKKRTEVSVIMEDNIEFFGNVPSALEKYLSQVPKTWDLLFDSDFYGLNFIEEPLVENKIIYKKKNEVTAQCHGSTKGCHFFLITLSAAEKLLKDFLPFNDVSDQYYNQLIRKLDLNVFWVEPPNVHKINRKSTWL